METHGPRDTMQQHVDRYLTRRKAKIEASTYADRHSVLSRFAAWWDTTRKVPKNLREQDVDTYLWGEHTCQRRCRGRVHRGAGLRDTLSDRSLNKHMSQLHGFFEWGIRYGSMRPEIQEPVSKINYVKPRTRRRLWLDAGQLADLVNGCDDPWERVVCALARDTAGRAGELVSLRVGDVDLDAGEIRWTRHKTRQDDDALPVTPDLDKELRRWFDHYGARCGRLRGGWYLIPRRKRTLTRGWLYEPRLHRARGLWITVNKHLRRVLGVEKLTGEGVHCARRSMARCLHEQLCAEGHPDAGRVVQALLGHATLEMTMHYIGVDSFRQQRDKVLRGRSLLN